jgi:hypothetical protein
MFESFTNFSTSTRLPTDNTGSFNGVLEVAVVNNLVSPSLDSPIQFNVFVSACEDIKFGEPQINAMSQYSVFKEPTQPFVPQSGIIDATAIAGTSEGLTDIPTNPEPIAPIAAMGSVADQTLNVFFGESPKSIRELNRRYVRHRNDVFLSATNNTYTILSLRDKGLGYYSGYDPSGIDTFGTDPCNITIPTYAQWFQPCYAGWRGSTRTKYVFNNSAPDSKPVVSRGGFTTAARVIKQSFPDNDTEELLTQRLTFNSGAFTAAGAATTNIGVNNTIEVETPYYNGVRFSPARLPAADFSNGCHSNLVSSVLYSPQGNPDPIQTALSISEWKSVGEDFTFFFFTGCPILYRYRIVPN